MSKSSMFSAHLRVDGLSKSFPDRRVFTDISFSVPHYDRVGIIGENGSGKSTLLRIIAGEMSYDAGRVETFQHASGGLDVGLLHQQPPFPRIMSVGDVLEASVTHLRKAAQRVDVAAQALAAAPDQQAVLDSYVTALEQAEHMGVWDIDARVNRTLDGLGLSALPRTLEIGQLSGGQAARLSLASLLLSTPEVLLLDEPTNHLDDVAVDFLSRVVSTWRGPVLIASHDRAFLDQTVVSLLDLDPASRPQALGDAGDDLATRGVTRFRGTYSEYVQFKQDARQRWQQQYQAEQAELQRLRVAVEQNQVVGHTDWKPRTESRIAKKFYADRNAKVVSRRVNDSRSRLAALEQNQIVKPPTELSFQGLHAARPILSQDETNKPLIHADHVSIEERLKPTSVTVNATERLLITGPNGVGKSTLLSILAKRLQPDSGRVTHREGITVGLLSQETYFGEDTGQITQTVYEAAVGPTVAEKVPLSTFGLIRPRDHNRPVGTLSIGQQRRLALAILLAKPPEVLLLDEPTNHLSLVLVSEIEASIERYPGAIVVVSHDRWLRDRWENRIMHLST